MMRLAAAVCLVLLYASPSLAITYYVSTTGNDTTGDGSSGNPWRNPQKCFSSGTPLVAGDICTVADGTYTAPSGGNVVAITAAASPNGQSGNPITLKSTNPLGAVLQIPSLSQRNTAILISARQHYVIEGFAMTGGTSTSTLASHHGIYIESSNTTGITIRKNWFHDIASTVCSNSSYGFDGMFITNAQNIVIERNRFNTIGRLRNGESGCSTTINPLHGDHGIYLAATNTVTIRRNLFYDVTRGYPIHVYCSGCTHTNTTILNNTFAGKDPTDGVVPKAHIMLSNTITTATIKNNLSYDADVSMIDTFSASSWTNVSITHNLMSTNDADAGQCTMLFVSAPPTGTTCSNNADNTSLGLANVGSNDYTLAAGSAAIDAGTDVGLAYNGSAPTIGAFDPPRFSTCSVEDGDASNLRITYTNNAFPPMLPVSGATGTTSRKAGAANTTANGTRVGDNRFDHTLTDAIVNGNTVDISTTTTNKTDSALIGGTLNQPYVQTLTNQSCTNNVGAAASHLFIQAAYEWHELRGTEAAPVMLRTSGGATENLDIQTFPGGQARLRISVTCTTADCPPTGFVPRYACASCTTAGTYTVVPDTFAADEDIKFCGTDADPDIPASGASTTEQLSTSGTFVAGAVVRTSNAIPTIDLDDDPASKTELEYCLAWDTDAVVNRAYTIRLYQQDGTALNTYTATPTVTIRTVSAGVGF